MPHRHIHLHTYSVGSGGTQVLSGHDEFNPSEPRNSQGEWTVGGSGKIARETKSSTPSSVASDPRKAVQMERLNALSQRFDEHFNSIENPRRFALEAQKLVHQVRSLQEAAQKGEDIAVELRRLRPISESSTPLTNLANLYLNMAKEAYIKGYGPSTHSATDHHFLSVMKNFPAPKKQLVIMPIHKN